MIIILKTVRFFANGSGAKRMSERKKNDETHALALQRETVSILKFYSVLKNIRAHWLVAVVLTIPRNV